MYRIHKQCNRFPIAFNPPLVLRANLLEKVNGNLGRFGLVSIIALGTVTVSAQLTMAQIPPNIQIPQNIEIPKVDTSAIDNHREELQRTYEMQQQVNYDMYQQMIDEDSRRRREAWQRSQAEKLRFFNPEVYLQYWDSLLGD
ncbi:MAG: hypothetical protein AB1589_37090 [Cyanobacteriota bacterium]